jgi:plastocyanin
VVIRGYVFPPIAAAPGATLTLVDQDDEPHTVTANDGSFRAGPFDNTAPGTLVAPTKAGTYPFHCEIHPTMHGTLVVNNQ